MKKTEEIIKNAFIDAICITDDIQNSSLSAEFDERLLNSCKKSRNKFYKCFNTTSKRIACIISVLFLSLNATVFGVEALRKPVVKSLQSFFVNVKDRLSGTKADNIALHFTDDVTEIIVTDYITSSPKEYLIDENEKISEFTQLLSNTEWLTPKTKYEAEADYIYWKFQFKSGDKTVTTVNMCGRIGKFGIVEINDTKKSYVYNISEQAYLDILAFTSRKYYLHQSDINLPEKEICISFKNQALSKLNSEEKKFVSKEIREAHIMTENLLLDSVSLLKEPDSPYWDSFITGEKSADPFSGEVYTQKEYCFNGVSEKIQNAYDTVKNDEVKNYLKIICEDLQSACDNHDIGSLFTVHESIHDLDYFGINYPAHFELLAPPDWNGINIYFGHLY